MSNPFNQPLPPRKNPKELGLDTRVSHLKRWSSELNPNDLGSASRALLEQLRLTNRAEMSSSDRFEWLESLAAPLQTILFNLRKHYLHKPFPLPEKSLSVAQLANTLNSELLVGYRLILSAKPDTSLFGKRSDRQRRLMACYRLVYHAGEVLCNHRLMYQLPPAGLWRNLHTYYNQICAHNWEREELTPFAGSSVTTIEHIYKKQVLLSLLPSQVLPAKEWNELMTRIDEWLPQIPLYRAAERPAGRLLYCIRFELDAPVAAGTEACCGACDNKMSGLLLDTAPLVNMLEWRIAGSPPQHAPSDKVDLVCHMSIESLHMMLRGWRIPTAPRETRKKVDFPLTMVTGLRAIHHVLRGKPKQTAAPAPVEKPQTLAGIVVPNLTIAEGGHAPEAPAFPQQAFLGQRDADGDIWETVFVGKELPKAASLWSEGASEEDVEELEARALDASGSGFRIELELPPEHGLQLGEMAALRESESDEWKLCLLRWVRRIDEKRASLGLERIAEQIHPVEVKVTSKGGGVPAILHGLTCYDNDVNSVLLMPLLPALASKKLALVKDGEEAAINLGANLAYSPLFESFAFTTVESEAAVRKLLPESRKAMGKGDDPFGDIWTSL